MLNLSFPLAVPVTPFQCGVSAGVHICAPQSALVYNLGYQPSLSDLFKRQGLLFISLYIRLADQFLGIFSCLHLQSLITGKRELQLPCATVTDFTWLYKSELPELKKEINCIMCMFSRMYVYVPRVGFALVEVTRDTTKMLSPGALAQC